jgi:hypothetical protein
MDVKLHLSKILIMKRTKIIYWISTVFIFMFEVLLSALTSQTAMAKEGIRHLGYPVYFGITLTIFNILGSLILVIPQVPGRIKEWAYAGFAFDFIFALVSNVATDGLNALTLLPLYVLCILMVSYFSYHKIMTLAHS